MRKAPLFAMGCCLLLLVAPLAGSTVRVQAAAPTGPERTPAPETGIPQSHWCYDVITQVAQKGIPTGYPPSTFFGKHVRTRGEFTRATWNALLNIHESGEFGLNASAILAREILNKLVAEFEPELIQLVTEKRLKAQLTAIDALCRDPKPRGVSSPRPYKAAPWGGWLEDPETRAAAQKEGARQAAEAWARGEITLLTPDRLPERFPQLSATLPVRYVPDATGNPRKLHSIAGHNREIWRRLREEPHPSGSSLGWVREVFDLKQAWRQRRNTLRLKRLPDTLVSCDGQFTFTFPPVHGLPYFCVPVVRMELSGSKPRKDAFPCPIPIDWERNIRLAEGPAGSGVVLIRSEHPIGGKRWQTRIRAVDLRTGWVLNAVAD